MVYDARVQRRIPVISSIWPTPCIPANENIEKEPQSQKSI